MTLLNLHISYSRLPDDFSGFPMHMIMSPV